MSSAFVTKHFFNPANVGDIDNANGVGRAGSVTCGAVLRVSLKIDNLQRVSEAKFKSAGCSYLVAACSFLTEAVKGKTTGEAARLYQSPEDLAANTSNDWPIDRNHCAALARDALVAAIRNYSDSVRDEWLGEEALICTCFGVSERTIETLIESDGLCTVAEVTKASKAGAGCQSCFPLIEDILAQHARELDSDLLGSTSH